MDPDLFFQLNDLGARPDEIQAVLDGQVSGENLHAYLTADVEGRRTPLPLPATEPIPVAPPPQLPVLASTPLPTILAPQQPVVRAVPPAYEEPIEYVRVEPEPANQDPIGGEGGPLGSWLVEPTEEAMNGYPSFGTQDLSPMVGPLVGIAVSTATEKLFDKVTGNGNGGVSKVSGVSARGYRTGRRRRRRLLTCSDKADIAYLVGQLGQGQLGKAAISALLSKRCS